jgi:hypothetical protein
MINEVLNLQIITTPGMTIEESEHLIKQLECAELAKTAFIRGELSLEDYCDILQLCGVNVDEYLFQIESNLHLAGIL